MQKESSLTGAGTSPRIPAYDFPAIGCYVDENHGSADDCNRRTIKFAMAYGFTVDATELIDCEPDDLSQTLSEISDDAVEFLNDLETRSFLYWTHEDNSLFLTANVESAREDCEFVSTAKQDEPTEDYRGEWLHINDHGNCTLYARGERADADGNCKVHDTEVWGIV